MAGKPGAKLILLPRIPSSNCCSSLTETEKKVNVKFYFTHIYARMKGTKFSQLIVLYIEQVHVHHVTQYNINHLPSFPQFLDQPPLFGLLPLLVGVAGASQSPPPVRKRFR